MTISEFILIILGIAFAFAFCLYRSTRSKPKPVRHTCTPTPPHACSWTDLRPGQSRWTYPWAVAISSASTGYLDPSACMYVNRNGAALMPVTRTERGLLVDLPEDALRELVVDDRAHRGHVPVNLVGELAKVASKVFGESK